MLIHHYTRQTIIALLLFCLQATISFSGYCPTVLASADTAQTSITFNGPHNDQQQQQTTLKPTSDDEAKNLPLDEFVRLKCESKLKFESIRQFKEFVAKHKQFVAEHAELIDKEPNKGNKFSEMFKLGGALGGGKADSMRRCIQDRQAIYDLEQLIDEYDRTRPCKMNQIEKLEKFAIKHLLDNTKSITLRFFTLFGVQIGMICKLNLMAHLKQADSEADQLDFIYSMASPTGWNVLINEYARKSMTFGTSAHQDNKLVNRIAKLVPGLSQVEHVDYLNFQHPLNDQIARNSTLRDDFELSSYTLEQGDKWNAKLSESLKQIISSCKNLDQFYVNSILSLTRLKELGLLVEYLSDIHEHSLTLHKWLAATSFCQLMVRVDLIDSDNMIKGAYNLKILHDDVKFNNENRHKLYSYVAEFEDIQPEALESAWCASVPEGQWRQKSEAMFLQSNKGESQSVAMRLLKQYIKGLERTFESDDRKDLVH